MSLQVQVLVEVRSGRWQEQRRFELLECTPDTGIAALKRQAAEAAVAAAAAGSSSEPGSQTSVLQHHQQQQLSFMGQRCEDGKVLRDYGVCHDWVAQVTGFVLHPAAQEGQPW